MNTEDSEFERIEREAKMRLKHDDDDIQVYKKPWVELSTNQILNVYWEVLKEWRGGHQVNGQIAFARAIEQALKERNT